MTRNVSAPSLRLPPKKRAVSKIRLGPVRLRASASSGGWVAPSATSRGSGSCGRLALPREGRRAADRKALEVVLLLGGFLPETAGLADAGHHLAGPMAGCVDVADGLFGDHALLLARVEDLRAVAGPDDVLAEIGSVDHEEVLEQLSVGEAVRIEGDLDRLGMTDVVLRGRVLVLPADPAYAGGDDPAALAKQLLHDPEAAPREDRALGVFAHLVVLPYNQTRFTQRAAIVDRRPPAYLPDISLRG